MPPAPYMKQLIYDVTEEFHFINIVREWIAVILFPEHSDASSRKGRNAFAIVCGDWPWL